MRRCISALALAASGCGHGSPDETQPDGNVADASDPGGDASSCGVPSLPLSEQTVFGPLFASDYRMYVLGSPTPDTVVIHGLTVIPGDPNHLLLALDGGIYAVPVARDACHHISGFAGAPTLMVKTGPTIARFGALAAGPNDVLFASYSFATDSTEHRLGLAEAVAGHLDPIYSIDLGPMSITGGDNASVAFVPAGLPGAGGLRVISDVSGGLYHVNYAADQSWFAISGATSPLAIPSFAYGYNYVPNGSPGFAQPSALVASGTSIDAYALDGSGDPILSTRVPFILQLGFSTGSCCEAMRAAATDPTTGDVIYAGLPAGELYLTRGFAPLLL